MVKHEVEPQQTGEIERKRALVRQMAGSEAFRKSPRLRTMLQHIAECTLSGRAEELTETRIAEQVFGREDYHPAEDNIVRVSARQLRTKLREYFEAEGRSEPWVVTIPKGSYVAAFEKREGARSVVAPPDANQVRDLRKRARAWQAWAAAGMGLAVLVAWLWVQNRQLRTALAAKGPVVHTLFDPFAQAGGAATELIVTDPALVLIRGVIHAQLTLEDYANRDYWALAAKGAPEEVRSGMLEALKDRQITSLADFRIAMEMARDYPGLKLFLHHARNRQARDFDSDDNFVLIGSYWSNPWAEMFEPQLRFRLGKDSCFDDTAIGRRFCAATLLERSESGYARVAVIRNGSRAGKVLLIAGLNMESTEAAGEFFLDPQSVGKVLRALGAKSVAEIPAYEMILQTYNVGGTGRSAEIVAISRD